MKRIFSILLVSLLVVGFASISYGAANYASDNVDIVGKFGGAEGISPFTEIIKVRYGFESKDAPTLSSGDVVVWNETSADGITISACILSGNNALSYAGVLVTDIQTSDSNLVTRASRNWGYMAIRGYCLAKIDSSEAAVNRRLLPNGATIKSSFAGTSGQEALSLDIGFILRNSSSDGLGAVILY